MSKSDSETARGKLWIRLLIIGAAVVLIAIAAVGTFIYTVFKGVPHL